MNTYTYNVIKGEGSYLLTVQAETAPLACKQVDVIVGDRKYELVETNEGTLEDYMGVESMERLEHSKVRSRLSDKKYTQTQTNTPMEGATRVHR